MSASTIVDGRKYMWDGEEYATEIDADAAAERYRGEGFEAIKIREGGAPHIYTRRVVTEVKVEGSPTA